MTTLRRFIDHTVTQPMWWSGFFFGGVSVHTVYQLLRYLT